MTLQRDWKRKSGKLSRKKMRRRIGTTWGKVITHKHFLESYVRKSSRAKKYVCVCVDAFLNSRAQGVTDIGQV
jgi:hypothetical protein